MHTHHLCRLRGKVLRQFSTLRSLSHEAGTTTIEFAFAIGIVFLMVFGLADLGRLVYSVSVVRAAAQEGARTGIVDISQIAPAIQEKLVGLDGDRAQIDVSMPDENSVAVDVTYEYRFMVPLIASAVGQKGVTLQSSASMIIR